jgi:prepilin-type N-terminal cleavage/methylation domain-containing protein
MSDLPVNRSRPAEQGFTLIELMIAIVVIVIGILGMSSVTATTIRNQDLSAARTDMAALADNKFEELRAAAGNGFSPVVPALDPGGDLTVATAGYNDVVTERGRTYTRLWLVTAGVGGTRNVTIRITAQAGGARAPASKDFHTLITM